MIPLSRLDVQTKSWQQQLAQAISSPEKLLEFLHIDPDQVSLANTSFSMKVPLDFVDRMQTGDPDDPLLRQVLPLADETLAPPGFSADPVGDLAASATHGLIHKYHGRALLITTPACAVHCRYCFRKDYPYQTDSAHGAAMDKALLYLGQQDEITEIILSGGDPLSLSDPAIQQLISKLEAIPHLETLRIHTRLPIVLPDRVTSDLLAILESSRFNVVIVVHCNHPNELSSTVKNGLARLNKPGITLLNQSVLLAGINDSAAILCQLSQQLFAAGTLPYYLHQLDPVTGSSHYQVSQEKALTIRQQLQNRLPGYLVPRLVQEIPGQPSKIPL